MNISKALIMTMVVTVFVGVGYMTALAGDPIVIGDYVWFDGDCNGVQDDGDDAGINDVLVWFYRDYDCNGVIDGDDAVYDYDFTRDDDFGIPGFYEIPSSGDRCFVVELDAATIPEGLFVRAGTSFLVATHNVDYFDADFGLCDEQVECGDCDGKITELTLIFHGTEAAWVEVNAKGKKKKGKGHHGNDQGEHLFAGEVASNGEFTFVGLGRDGEMGTEITIFVDGNENAKIHTSCSKPIGPGLIAGDFEVIDGYSRNGGQLCPVENPGSGYGECAGKVTELTFQYMGDEEAFIEVDQKKDGNVFADFVAPGDTFTIYGTDKKGTLGTEIYLYADGANEVAIHTSCSRPIGPGLVAGDFLVIEGYSREGGELPPL